MRIERKEGLWVVIMANPFNLCDVMPRRRKTII